MSRSKTTVTVDRAGRSHQFPPTLNLDYQIDSGRLRTRSLEAHIVDHCNLSCAECCSLSPLLPKWFESPEAFQRDLELAATIVAPSVFKLVGGEPLLHPQIATMARIAAESGIAPRISLTTNGLLLGRMEDELWHHLDAMTISIYPQPGIPAAIKNQAEAKAAQFDVELNWKQQDHFVNMNVDSKRLDLRETREIYDRCWLRERCHILRSGTLFMCTRPPHMATLHDDPITFMADGYSLQSPTASAEMLRSYLQRDVPLEACAYCRGGDAEMSPHRLVSRSDLRQLKRRSA